MIARAPARWIVVVTVASGVGALSWMRIGCRLRESHDAQHRRAALRADLFQRGQREFRVLPVRTFDELAADGAVGQFVGTADLVAAPSADRLQALQAEVATLFDLMFVHRSVEGYSAWRMARGAELIPLDEATSFWRVDLLYEGLAGNPLPEGSSAGGVFADLWAAAPHAGGGRRWPTGIASGPEGMAIATGRFDWAARHNRPSLEGRIPHELWIGDQGFTYTPLWRFRGEHRGEIPERLRRTECAEVGLLLAFPDGSRRPLIATFLWDPAVRNWVLFRINAYNFPAEKSGCIIY